MTEIVVAQKMWQRRGTTAQWAAANPTLNQGEIGFEYDNTDPTILIGMKVGNGVDAWLALGYFGGAGGGGGASPALQFNADTGSTADSDPGAGLLKWNNATQASATVIYLDDQTSDAVSLTSIWPALQTGGFLYLQHATDPDTWQIWDITAVTDATGYVKLAVTLLANGGSFADADAMLVTIQNGRTDQVGVTAGSVTAGPWVLYNGTVQADGKFDGGTTPPAHSTRLNYDGNFHATRFYGNGSNLTGITAGSIDQRSLPLDLQSLFTRGAWGFYSIMPGSNAGTFLGVLSGVFNSLGTATATAIAATSTFTRQPRVRYTSSATAGNSAGSYADTAYLSRNGGFFWSYRFGIADAAAVANARMFVGLRAAVGAPANANPSSYTDLIGVGADTGDTNLQVIYNDSSGTASKIDLGAAFPVNTRQTDFYELQLLCVVGSGEVGYHVRNVTTGATATGALSSDLPSVSTLLAWTYFRNNGTTALAVALDSGGWTVGYNLEG